MLSTWAMAQPAPNTFLVHNLVSDLSGIADHQDANLVNPWGNGFGSTPFWIGNNGTGTSTLYDGTGAAKALVVDIPAAGGGEDRRTGYWSHIQHVRLRHISIRCRSGQDGFVPVLFH